MTALALTVPRSTSDLTRLTQQVTAARSAIQDALDATTVEASRMQAKAIREAFSHLEDALVLRVEATRLEMEALRRLAQLDALDHLTPSYRAAARWYQKLTDDEFDAAVDLITAPTTGAVASTQIRRIWAMERTRQGRTAPNFEEVGHGSPWNQSEDVRRALYEAASSLMYAADRQARRLSIRSIAESVVQTLTPAGWETSDIADLAVGEVVDIIREGINAGVDGDLFPEWITFYNDDPGDRGWFRIRWSEATVGEFRWMVTYREQHAQSAVDAAKELRALFDEYFGGTPDEVRLIEARARRAS